MIFMGRLKGARGTAQQLGTLAVPEDPKFSSQCPNRVSQTPVTLVPGDPRPPEAPTLALYAHTLTHGHPHIIKSKRTRGCSGPEGRFV